MNVKWYWVIVLALVIGALVYWGYSQNLKLRDQSENSPDSGNDTGSGASALPPSPPVTTRPMEVDPGLIPTGEIGIQQG